MDTRAAIDSLLDKAYAARRTQDVQGACALFNHSLIPRTSDLDNLSAYNWCSSNAP